MRVVFSSVPNDSRIVSFTNSSVEHDLRGTFPPVLVDDRNIEEDIEEEESRVDISDDDNLDRVGREFVCFVVALFYFILFYFIKSIKFYERKITQQRSGLSRNLIFDIVHGNLLSFHRK
jgi:hypothetical protein